MKYILIILLFASCNATKQAAKHLNKAFKKDRVYVAKATRDSFPCIELLRTDTALVVLDSVVYVECPDYSNVVNKVTHDTSFIKGVNKTIRVPVYIPVQTKIITKYFEDSAKIFIAQKETAKANVETEKYKNKSQRRGNFITWLIVAILALIATTILLIRSKLKR